MATGLLIGHATNLMCYKINNIPLSTKWHAKIALPMFGCRRECDQNYLHKTISRNIFSQFTRLCSSSFVFAKNRNCRQMEKVVQVVYFLHTRKTVYFFI